MQDPEVSPYKRFLDSLDAPCSSRSWADEVDLVALQALRGEERGKAWAVLKERVKRGVDYRLPGALFALDRLRAIPLLVEALRVGTGQCRVAAAHCLSKTRHKFAAMAALYEMQREGEPDEREMAAAVLGPMACDVCFEPVEANENRDGFAGLDGRYQVLCMRHNEVCKAVAADGDVNWFALDRAEFRLSDERPSLSREPEKWVEWDPLPRLIELYRQVAAEPSAQESMTRWKRAHPRKAKCAQPP